MHINKLHATPHPVGGPKYRELGQQATEGSVPSSAVDQANNIDSGLNSVRRLQEQLKQVPDARRARIEAAKIKLDQGDYLSREAAVQSASSILNET